MVKYTVEVFTGDAFTAGNAKAVFIKLIGTKGSSEPQILDPFTDCEAGATLTVSCKESLGPFFLVQLELKALELEDHWFCSKVIVTDPEGRQRLFPCYQWLSPKKKTILREATGLWLPYMQCAIPEYTGSKPQNNDFRRTRDWFS
uniref:PLAT domain-containing protein n=1 Tax=Pygocentrus nattereri TaxID=42514 RepID=A0AAR2J5P0_PYGNA